MLGSNSKREKLRRNSWKEREKTRSARINLCVVVVINKKQQQNINWTTYGQSWSQKGSPAYIWCAVTVQFCAVSMRCVQCSNVVFCVCVFLSIVSLSCALNMDTCARCSNVVGVAFSCLSFKVFRNFAYKICLEAYSPVWCTARTYHVYKGTCIQGYMHSYVVGTWEFPVFGAMNSVQAIA